MSGTLRTACAIAVLALASGCATAPQGAAAPGAAASAPAAAAGNPTDPWENWNRKVFSFNERLDRVVLKPAAETYRKVVPSLVRTGIDNFLGNIYDVWSTANHFLQGKVDTGLQMGMRVLTNTLFGLGGVLDPATEMRLVKRSEDFGQTLGKWGLGNGPYLVLPVIGPSTLRDSAGLVVDRQFAPSTLPEHNTGVYAVQAIEVVNVRANLLSAGNLVDQVALDKYSFVRDAYLSRRRDALYDGAPPMDTYDDAEAPADGAAAPKPAAAAAASGAARPASAASSASAPAK